MIFKQTNMQKNPLPWQSCKTAWSHKMKAREECLLLHFTGKIAERRCFDGGRHALIWAPKNASAAPHLTLLETFSTKEKCVCISGKWYRACQHVKEIHVSFCEVAYDQTHVLHEIFVERERPLKLVIWTNGLCQFTRIVMMVQRYGEEDEKTTNPRQGRRRRTWKRWKRKKMISRNSYFHSFFWL